MTSGTRNTGNPFSHETKPMIYTAMAGRFFKAPSTTTVGEDPAIYFNFYQNITNLWQDSGTDNPWTAQMTSSAIGMAQEEQDRLETFYASLSHGDKETVKSIAAQIDSDGMNHSAFSLLSVKPWHLAIAALLLTSQVKPAAALQTNYTFYGSSDASLCDPYMDCNAFYVTDGTGATVLKGAQGNLLKRPWRIPLGDSSCVALDKAENMTADILNARASNMSFSAGLNDTCTMKLDKQSSGDGIVGNEHYAEKVVIQGFSDKECNTMQSRFSDAYAACIQDAGNKDNQSKDTWMFAGCVFGAALALGFAVYCICLGSKNCQDENEQQQDMEVDHRTGYRRLP